MKKYFKPLDNMPLYTGLLDELNRLLDEGIIAWPKQHAQICLNSIPEFPNDYELGTGSLDFDWGKKETLVDSREVVKLEVPRKPRVLSDADFTVLCSQFKGTLFEEVYNELCKHFTVGRIRIMKSTPKSCLSWHIDHSIRVHYPMLTREGCLMVVEDEVAHMPQDSWWIVDTRKLHTAFNASKESRIHLVVCVANEDGDFPD
jgi:hypothetical protein